MILKLKICKHTNTHSVLVSWTGTTSHPWLDIKVEKWKCSLGLSWKYSLGHGLIIDQETHLLLLRHWQKKLQMMYQLRVVNCWLPSKPKQFLWKTQIRFMFLFDRILFVFKLVLYCSIWAICPDSHWLKLWTLLWSKCQKNRNWEKSRN